MFRTKKEVDRHVHDIFKKLTDETEKTMRCCKIANLYYQVGDYESAKRYMSRYLEVRKDAKAHKLNAAILEAMYKKDAALAQYKISYELDSRQDLILKICELMADPDVEIDVGRAKYWLQKAESQYPKHAIVFQLKEKILFAGKSLNSDTDFEHLILGELSIRPTDMHLKMKLLKYYMDRSKFEEAYQYVRSIEATNIHRDSLVWYQMLCDLLIKCKVHRHPNWSFWILYISSLERCAALSLKEHGKVIGKLLEPAQAVYNYDQHMFEAKAQSFASYPILTENIFNHMYGQLNFHFATLLLKNTQRDQGSWTEAMRLCVPLFFRAMIIKPLDLTASWAINLDTSIKNHMEQWQQDGSYRCSQAAHILESYSKGHQKKLLSDIEKFCFGTWKERLYQRIFTNRLHQKIKTSYFANNNEPNPPLKFVSTRELQKYDEVAEGVWPDSLHHQVWPAVKISNNFHSENLDEPRPNLSSHLFPELQNSVSNLNQASPVTISRLDIDSFLNIAALCASANVKAKNDCLLNPGHLLPADLMPPLCTAVQEKWWKYAYKLYRKENASDTLNDIRQHLQRGLEIIRCIGNHGLHPIIMVHLARMYSYRVKTAEGKNEGIIDISALKARCQLYWSSVIPLLERLQNNQTMRSSNFNMFNYQGRDMSNVELNLAIEEGKLFLAGKLIEEKHYEQAIESLKSLNCPEASFEQGKVYKKMADESMQNLSKEHVTSEMRAHHVIILSRARNCFYLTLDRLRSPNTNPEHPLNSELCNYITAIETELSRVDPDTIYNDAVIKITDIENASDRSYSSAHSEEVGTQYLSNKKNCQHSLNWNCSRNQRQASTPRRSHDMIQMSKNILEARPSPERLDAQIRQLVHAIESLKAQNREQSNIIISKLEDLIKITSIQKSDFDAKPHLENETVNCNLHDDIFDSTQDDYPDYSNNMPTQLSTSLAMPQTQPSTFMAPQPSRHPFSSMIYPPTGGLPSFYAQGRMPFGESGMQPLPTLYPKLYSMPPLFPKSPVVDQTPVNSITHMTENCHRTGYFFQPGLPARLPNQSSHDSSMHPTPMYLPFQQRTDVINTDNLNATDSNGSGIGHVEVLSSSVISKSSSIVTSPVTNVIASSFDTPENPLAPHKYQISMPSKPTIPTTVILPPLVDTLTTTSSMITLKGTSSSFLPTNSHESSVELVPEVEHDPIPDFAPIIPLPAEVPINTGEENEETLFCARAKLFRFLDREWKERGIGNVKLLKNSLDGKVRLLMRREQVLKICANHLLRSDMELSPMTNNDKAWIWVANDFADEKLHLEKLCIKFKTVDEAQSFREQFDKARLSLSSSTKKPEDEKCLSNSKMASDSTMKSDTLSQESNQPSTDSSLQKLSGFSFVKAPLIKHVTSLKKKESNMKIDSSTKINPFVNFSFGNAMETHKNVLPSTNMFSGRHEMTSMTTGRQSSPSSLQLSSDDVNRTISVVKGSPGQKSLSEMFKPAVGSWECKTCYTRNDVNASKCVACQTTSSNTTSTVLSQFATTKNPIPQVSETDMKSLNCRDCFCKNQLKCDQCLARDTLPDTSVIKPISDMFRPPEGSWSCSECYIQNIASNCFCVACKTPQDASIHLKPTMDTFPFGVEGNENLSRCASGFDFQTTSPNDTVSHQILISKSNVNHGFGTPPHPTNFNFGTPGKSFSFRFHNEQTFVTSNVKSPQKAYETETSDDEQVTDSEDIYFAPVVPLPDKVECKTGEEDEEVCYSHRAKLFKFDSSTKEWKERGLGDIKLLRHNQTKRYRLVMRRDQVLKICLNHSVTPNMEISAKDDKTWLWNAGDYSEGEVEFLQLACRFKTTDIAQNFKHALDKAMKDSIGIFASPKTDSPEIEMIYEIQVTPEEKVKALRLKLPGNFYAYKQKQGCPGCIGCHEVSMTCNGSSKNSAKSSIFISEASKEHSHPSNFVFGGIDEIHAASSVSTCGPEALEKVLPKTVTAPSKNLQKNIAFGIENSPVSDLSVSAPPLTSFNDNAELVSEDSVFREKSTENVVRVNVAVVSDDCINKNKKTSMFHTFPDSMTNSIDICQKNTETSPFSEVSAHAVSNFDDVRTTKELTTKIIGDVSFLPTSHSISFSDLISQMEVKDKPAFRQDPGFTFQGAGSSVFGTKTNPTVYNVRKTLDDQTKSMNGDYNEEITNDIYNEDEHDPHFEPIIPLPDTIEVRTGEEDELKIYCQRAKLYRYDNNSKEWKERGTGEMKILHHREQETYRLLLRREQVHKVVCNLLLTPDIEFRLLNTCERAWVWAGMNYAEEGSGVLEQLAVRFKTSDLALSFREAIDKVQVALREKQSKAQDNWPSTMVTQLKKENLPDEAYSHCNAYIYDEDIDYEDDDSQMKMFETQANVFTKSDQEQWLELGSGALRVVYDSEFFGAKILFEANNTGDLVSETVISIDTRMECQDDICIWAATDYAVSPPMRRTLKALFPSNKISEEMYDIFKEGQECATKADIREFCNSVISRHE